MQKIEDLGDIYDHLMTRPLKEGIMRQLAEAMEYIYAEGDDKCRATALQALAWSDKLALVNPAFMEMAKTITNETEDRRVKDKKTGALKIIKATRERTKEDENFLRFASGADVAMKAYCKVLGQPASAINKRAYERIGWFIRGWNYALGRLAT